MPTNLSSIATPAVRVNKIYSNNDDDEYDDPDDRLGADGLTGAEERRAKVRGGAAFTYLLPQSVWACVRACMVTPLPLRI